MNRFIKQHAQKATCVLALLATLGVVRADTKLNEAVTATAVQVDTKPARLTGYTIVNRDATNPIFLHLYNGLVANVTVGTTTQDYLVPVPAGGAVVLMLNDSTQFTFPKGLVMAATTSPLSSGSTAPGTAAVVLISYGVNP